MQSGREETEEVVPVPDGPPPAPSHPGAGEWTDESLLAPALFAMMDGVRAHAGGIYLLAPGEPVLEMAVMAGLPRAFAAPWERVGLGAPIPVAEALRERRLVWVGGEEEMARRYPRIALVLPYPCTLAALPVATAATAFGSVFVTWPGAHPPELSDWERERLLTASGELARSLERRTAEGRPVRRGHDVEIGAPVAGVSSAVEAVRMVGRLPDGLCSLDLDGRVTYANGAASRRLGVPVRKLLGHPLWRTLPWLEDPVHQERHRAALISRQPTSFTALRPPGDWLTFQLHPSSNGVSVRISPARGPAAEAPVPEAVRAAAPPAVGLVAISHLVNLSGALTEAVCVQDVIDLVADEIMPAVGSRVLAVVAPEAGRMRVLGHRGYRDPAIVDRCDGMAMSSPTPAAQVLASGAPAFLESEREMRQCFPDRPPVSDGMAAWAYLPLIASGRPVGTCVLGYPQPHRFGADERALLTSLGGLVAQALERARLYDAKHRLAHGLQSALLPRTLPELPGLEAAARYLAGTEGMDIGGDFYDLLRVGDRPAAVIGDVQGHNVTAAGLMGQVRTAVRAYSAVGQSPGQVMECTNRLLLDLDVELLASCIYLHLDPDGKRVMAAGAGHPQPLLREPDGRVRPLDLAQGPLLGIDAEAVYRTVEFPFPPGSVLMLYTDGLVECPGTDVDAELAALSDHLGAAGGLPLDRVADGVLALTSERRLRTDDIALLLLRSRSRSR
ncbi:SpoIIE family protein phosphatase [Actinacidiphila glaucinigra]|uniref:SpoIIE family protein phosphatase n=1 Tax=Actinacidiphila glaucinigra TaxID=235986 RepID=UPI0037AC826E